MKYQKAILRVIISILTSIFFHGNSYAGLEEDGTLKWSIELRDGGTYCPAIAQDGTIYIASLDKGYVYAINPDGKEKWVGQLYDGGNMSAPAIGDDGTIYVGRDGGSDFFAFNPDGTTKWVAATGQRSVWDSPVIGEDGTIYWGTATYSGEMAYVYAFNPNGSQKWVFPIENYYSEGAAIGSDGTIYVGATFAKKLYAISTNGLKNWEFTPALSRWHYSGLREH